MAASEAAGGTDKEKEHYLPGIWMMWNYHLQELIRVNRLLILPSVMEKEVTVKAQVRNFNPAQVFYGDDMDDSVEFSVLVREKKSGSVVMRSSAKFITRRDNLTEVGLAYHG